MIEEKKNFIKLTPFSAFINLSIPTIYNNNLSFLEASSKLIEFLSILEKNQNITSNNYDTIVAEIKNIITNATNNIETEQENFINKINAFKENFEANMNAYDTTLKNKYLAFLAEYTTMYNEYMNSINNTIEIIKNQLNAKITNQHTAWLNQYDELVAYTNTLPDKLIEQTNFIPLILEVAREYPDMFSTEPLFTKIKYEQQTEPEPDNNTYWKNDNILYKCINNKWYKQNMDNNIYIDKNNKLYDLRYEHVLADLPLFNNYEWPDTWSMSSIYLMLDEETNTPSIFVNGSISGQTDITTIKFTNEGKGEVKILEHAGVYPMVQLGNIFVTNSIYLQDYYFKNQLEMQQGIRNKFTSGMVVEGFTYNLTNMSALHERVLEQYTPDNGIYMEQGYNSVQGCVLVHQDNQRNFNLTLHENIRIYLFDYVSADRLIYLSNGNVYNFFDNTFIPSGYKGTPSNFPLIRYQMSSLGDIIYHPFQKGISPFKIENIYKALDNSILKLNSHTYYDWAGNGNYYINFAFPNKQQRLSSSTSKIYLHKYLYYDTIDHKLYNIEGRLSPLV